MPLPVATAGTLPDVARIDANDALQHAWDQLRELVPGLRDAEVIAAPGHQRGSGDRDVDWTGRKLPRLLVPQRTLAAGPEETLAWLLHFAAHALTPGGGLSVAAHGRWHTQEYRVRAETLGLRVTGSAGQITTMAATSSVRFRAVLRLLRPVAVPQPAVRSRRGQTQIPAQCSCDPPRRLRILRSTLDRGEIRCLICNSPFRPVESS